MYEYMVNLLHRWVLSNTEEENLHCSPAAKHSFYPTSQQMLHPEFSMPEVLSGAIYVIWSDQHECKASLLPYSRGHSICFYRISVGARVKVGTLPYTALWSCSTVFNTVVIWICSSFDLSVQAAVTEVGRNPWITKSSSNMLCFWLSLPGFQASFCCETLSFLLLECLVHSSLIDNSPTWYFSFSNVIEGKWLGKWWAPGLFLCTPQ